MINTFLIINIFLLMTYLVNAQDYSPSDEGIHNADKFMNDEMIHTDNGVRIYTKYGEEE